MENFDSGIGARRGVGFGEMGLIMGDKCLKKRHSVFRRPDPSTQATKLVMPAWSAITCLLPACLNEQAEKAAGSKLRGTGGWWCGLRSEAGSSRHEAWLVGASTRRIQGTMNQSDRS